MSDYDFKEVLDCMEEQTYEGIFATENYEAIQHALRLADRLQRGEVSEDMIATVSNGTLCWDDICEEIFKAMTAKLMEEIQNDG